MEPRSRLQDISPFRRRSLTIPPDSLNAWLRLAVWEIWMGMLLCAAVYGGLTLIAAAPGQIVTLTDLSRCYGDPPVPMPCERVLHRGLLNVAFSAFIGVTLLACALWLLWELWSAVEPRPITDDFLKLLDQSFGRDWRKPQTWPWARAMWAYGFTAVGATLAMAVAMLISTFRPGR
jgi:hypothetical protein